MSSLLSVLDPSMLFVIGCLAVPMFIGNVTHEERVAYVTHPMMIGMAAMVLVCAVWSRLGKRVKLSLGELLLSRWYLWNGAAIHFVMDGGVGALKQNKLFVDQYHLVDKRYAAEVSGPVVIGYLELALYTPLCLAVYLGYKRGASWRPVVEVITCVCHLYGALVYCLDEHLHDYKNLPFFDAKLEFSFDHILYFWFGYGANMVWVVLPLIFMVRAAKQCSAATAHNAAKVKRN